MSRTRSHLAILIPVLVLALLASGCGDTGKARQYCIDGDAAYNEALEIGRSLISDEQQFLKVMLNDDVAGLIALEPKLREMNESIDDSMEYLEKAADYYNKVLGLEDPGDYAEYARLMLEATTKNRESLVLGRNLIDRVTALVRSAESGQPPDFQSSIRTGSSTVTLLDELVREIRAIEREARLLAGEKDLF